MALLSKSTINEYHRQCKGVFERLKDDAGLVINPFAFDTMNSRSESREAFSEEELRLIGEKLTPFCRPLFIIGTCTGLTLGDICLLEWDNIRGNFIVRRRNKTGAFLEIPMLPPVKRIIEEQRNAQRDGKYILPEHAAMYKKNRAGVSYRIRSFLQSIEITTTRDSQGARRASVKDFHSLRHTFAYMAGVYQMPLAIVQSILGHMTPEMTEHYQAHASREDKVRFMRQLPNFLEDSSTVIERGTPAAESIRRKFHDLIDNIPEDRLSDIFNEVKKSPYLTQPRLILPTLN